MVTTSSRPDGTQDADWASKLLLRQITEHANGISNSIAGNLVNCGILLVLFHDVASAGLLLTFGGTSLAAAYLRHHYNRQVPASCDPAILHAALARIDFAACFMGLFWGGMIAAFFTLASEPERMFLGILAAGMMSAGTITFRTVPSAAKIYILCMVPGLLYSFLLPHQTAGLAAIALMACYTLVLLVHIRRAGAAFDDAVLHELQAERSAETIRILLNDSEEQGSDWLFELDSRGNLVAPSERFAAAAMRPLETLDGKFFFDLFDEGQERDRLVDHHASQRAFRNQIVGLTIDGEKCWWSVSARPIGARAGAYRGCIADITKQRRAEEHVNYMAHFDALTELPNRFLFNERMAKAMRGTDRNVGLLYLDLDHFKSINDTLGHPVGDKLLCEVARRLEQTVSRREMVARLGGDEFAVMVSGARLAKIDAIAAAIVSELSRPFCLGDHDVVTGTSIGMAISGEDSTHTEELFRKADLALYEAKGRGRNRAVLFEPGMDEAAQYRRMLELDLRASLGKSEMQLHYQPLINVSSGAIKGYEALIRWVHPTRGVVMPDTFIPVAEETGMIVQIGEWAIRKALDDLATWPEEISVSVNLSPVQMRSPSLISTVLNALATTGVDPARVCLEITETVLMQDSTANIETLHKLRSLGVHIALDDFGTGYSSLNYLRSFPFSKIKIDKCFIGEIDAREDCQAIVRSVIQLADSLGMETTAEGVERDSQLAQLLAEGCGEAQGFLYSPAIPVAELSDLRMPRPVHFTNIAGFDQAPTPKPEDKRRKVA